MPQAKEDLVKASNLWKYCVQNIDVGPKFYKVNYGNI
jgi:hypothetical protein